MSKSTNQHYVPQFYLKGFTHDGEQLYFFDKKTGLSKPSNIRNMASERGFYDFAGEAMSAYHAAVERGEFANEDPQLLAAAANPRLIDEELTKFEGDFSPIYRQFLDDVANRRRIGPQPKLLMAYYLAKQYLRTPEARRLLIQLAEIGMTAWLEARTGISLENANLRIEYNKDHAPTLHGQALFNPELLDKLVAAMTNHIWLVGVNRTTQPFYTSDHPVVRVVHDELAGAGFASRGVEIAFPLDSRYILTLYERGWFQHLSAADGRYVDVDEDGVKYFNRHQVVQSYRRVYCADDAFDFAIRLCNDYPEVRNMDHPRVIVERQGHRDTQVGQPSHVSRSRKPQPSKSTAAMTRRTRKRLRSQRADGGHRG